MRVVVAPAVLGAQRHSEPTLAGVGAGQAQHLRAGDRDHGGADRGEEVGRGIVVMLRAVGHWPQDGEAVPVAIAVVARRGRTGSRSGRRVAGQS